MISSQQKEVFGIFDLVCEQKDDGLNGLLASVNIISKKEVVF